MIRDQLAQAGVQTNTIVIYTADNLDVRDPAWRQGFPYEGASRPAIIRDPHRKTAVGKTCDASRHIDMAPAILDFAASPPSRAWMGWPCRLLASRPTGTRCSSAWINAWPWSAENW